MCKKAAAMFFNLDWKKKGKKENEKPFTEQQISSNVPHESIRAPDAEYLTANADLGFNILDVYLLEIKLLAVLVSSNPWSV